MRVAAIIVAGGRGERLGGGVPKPLVDLGGSSILARAVGAFDRSERVDALVLVVPADVAADDVRWVPATRTPLRVATGGPRRQDSVARGFDLVDAAVDVVLVHDAARPFVSGEIIARTIDAAAEAGAALAALAARDTVKQRAPGGGAPSVAATLPRESIYLAQTPQAFKRDVLARAIALGRGGVEATDEAALAERAGAEVRLVDGDARNIKITTPDDLELARQIAGGASVPETRIGTGYDLHRLVPDRALVLGGVAIPFDRGLAGHSDADVLCHAITDAVLGGAAQGDIGRHFPDDDPAWKDASSVDLLRRAVGIARQAGWAVANVDCVVVAERPRLAPHADRMRDALAAALGVAVEAVGVKGKTNEGVDAIGRGEAIAAHAVALLTRVR
jgi:2-C-methyl-D-erythritol 4-phosphate cytidylyltransferase/2-C-methyl-D-erythritol 2,4-cyclodiphosphate synthase